jgi:hypothetical protein
MVVGATFGLPSAAPRAVLVALSPLFSPPPRDVIRQYGDYPWTQSPRMHARPAADPSFLNCDWVDRT